MKYHPLIPALFPTLIMGLLSAQATAQGLPDGWIVCMRDLELRETLIDHADERELVLRSAYGIRSRVSMNDVLFMVRTQDAQEAQEDLVGAPTPQQSPVRLFSLIDGQVIRGSIIEPDMPEQIAFTLIAGRDVHGRARVPIEQVLRIADESAQPQVQPADPLIDDTVQTRTGDEIIGFIESVGPLTRIAMSDGSELDIETSRIESIQFANEPAVMPGIYLSFTQQEVLRAGMFKYDNQQPIMIDVDTISLGLDDTGNSTWIFDTDTLRSLQVIDPGLRVVALSELVPDRVDATGDRDWTPAPRVLDRGASHPTLRSIDFPSPMRAHYPIPIGAARFACSIQAPIERWTDCVIRIVAQSSRGGSTLLEQRLNAQQPTAEINVPLPADTTHLVIEIDPGENGPIQDRVLLRRPRLLVED